MNSTNSTSGDQASLSEIVIVSIIVTIIATLTAGGNLMVMISFKMDKQLQTVSNYFLLSLSVADLAIGLFSMPLYTVQLIRRSWPLGGIACDLWLSLDYTMSNASVANLLLISFDRYLSITRPLTYRAKRTPKRAAIMIFCAWVVSIILWTPWIYGWPHLEGRRTVPEDDCYIQFLKSNQYVTIATAIAAFYLPVFIMCVLYFKIYLETEKRQRGLEKLQAHSTDSDEEISNRRNRYCWRRCCKIDEADETDHEDEWSNTSPKQNGKNERMIPLISKPPDDIADTYTILIKLPEEGSSKASIKMYNEDDTEEELLKRTRKLPNHKERRRGHERKQDTKAAKTLSAILLAFIITWTPYNLFVFVEAFQPGFVHETVYGIEEGKYLTFN
ncbi:DgyrCDS2912 [Dimorphilus gyrociliatus]|uniref:DgyrCDS2912 n=1 Tax=Dimorphilus gyrociliatus TaxID=2664684 RepID=A0A7I8VBT8_9ANNE|nr:DgyrCDS2912 [Dimorphilus gyrociliatus]